MFNLSPRVPGQRIVSRHCRGLLYLLNLWIGFIVIALSICVGLSIFSNSAPYALPTSAALFSLGLAVGQNLISTAHMRVGTVQILMAEIAGICQAIMSLDAVERFRELDPRSNRDLRGEERYMDVFASSIDRLASLDQNSIESITRFYTHLKVSRDAALLLSRLVPNDDDPEEFNAAKQAVARELLVCLSAGRRALVSLAEDPNAMRSKTSDIAKYVRKQSIGI